MAKYKKGETLLVEVTYQIQIEPDEDCDDEVDLMSYATYALLDTGDMDSHLNNVKVLKKVKE